MELDAADDLLNRVDTDRPLLTGPSQAIEDLESIKGFPSPVLLNHQRKGVFRPLARRKSLLAPKALPAPPDRFLILAQAGIHDLTFKMTAKGTLHLSPKVVNEQ